MGTHPYGRFPRPTNWPGSGLPRHSSTCDCLGEYRRSLRHRRHCRSISAHQVLPVPVIPEAARDMGIPPVSEVVPHCIVIHDPPLVAVVHDVERMAAGAPVTVDMVGKPRTVCRDTKLAKERVPEDGMVLAVPAVVHGTPAAALLDRIFGILDVRGARIPRGRPRSIPYAGQHSTRPPPGSRRDSLRDLRR